MSGEWDVIGALEDEVSELWQAIRDIRAELLSATKELARVSSLFEERAT